MLFIHWRLWPDFFLQQQHAQVSELPSLVGWSVDLKENKLSNLFCHFFLTHLLVSASLMLPSISFMIIKEQLLIIIFWLWQMARRVFHNFWAFYRLSEQNTSLNSIQGCKKVLLYRYAAAHTILVSPGPGSVFFPIDITVVDSFLTVASLQLLFLSPI